jgi:hypothetical protein
MGYREDYPAKLEISDEDMSETQRVLVDAFIRQGEFQTRDALIELLEKDIATYLDEVDGMPNEEWINGVRYSVHIIREAKLNGSGKQ